MTRPKRVLVVCHEPILAGGLLRFDWAAPALAALGYETTFATLAPRPRSKVALTAPVIPFAQAEREPWDAVMVPGAGFPASTVRALARLQVPNFGLRVQHVLNEVSRKPAFLAVNRSFQPHVVVFNNPWPPGSFTDFSGDRFHLLQGAVDTTRFRPMPRSARADFIVGGLANKHPDLLIDAVRALPGVKLRLFGADTRRLAWRRAGLIRSGMLELCGPLSGVALPQFQQSVDCVVSVETEAGWANLAAEAAAAGTPAIATPHGVGTFARDKETALIIQDPSPATLARAIASLRDDPALAARLATSARAAIEPFTWEVYARGLADILEADRSSHYFAAPDFGLHGKWPIAERLAGLEPLLAQAAGKTVADFGAAEGAVARAFLDHGATFVTGFELDPGRVVAAQALCGSDRARFHAADLSDWPGFAQRHPGVEADIVLYLGLQQHLPKATRASTLKGVAARAKTWLAFRAPDAVYRIDRIDEILAAEGFEPAGDRAAPGEAGPITLFRRKGA